MGAPKGNQHSKGVSKGKTGRKGFGIENAKKHFLEQSYYIANKVLEKTNKQLTEKEKIDIAVSAVKATLPKEIQGNLNIRAEVLNKIEKATKEILQNYGEINSNTTVS